MIRWGHQGFLYLLLLIPLLAISLQVFKRRRGRRLRESLVSTQLLQEIAPGLSAARQRFKDLLLLLAMTLLIIALADPQVGSKIEEVKREGIDLVVAVDVSTSMLARDIAPSRLDKAKHEVASLLDRLKGDRVAIVAFSGKAVIECPLTLDYGAAQIFLDVLEPGLISLPGTALGAAITTSLKAFQQGSQAGKAILLITDGEDQTGEYEEALKLAKADGVTIHAIGIGSPQGVPIPISERGGVYKKDREGTVIVTKLDEATLQKITETTGGVYQRCSSGEDELNAIFAALAGLEKGEFGSRKFTAYEHRYQPILALAILALIGELLLSDRRRPLPKFLRILAIKHEPETQK